MCTIKNICLYPQPLNQWGFTLKGIHYYRNIFPVCLRLSAKMCLIHLYIPRNSTQACHILDTQVKCVEWLNKWINKCIQIKVKLTVIIHRYIAVFVSCLNTLLHLSCNLESFEKESASPNNMGPTFVVFELSKFAESNLLYHVTIVKSKLILTIP